MFQTPPTASIILPLAHSLWVIYSGYLNSKAAHLKYGSRLECHCTTTPVTMETHEFIGECILHVDITRGHD